MIVYRLISEEMYQSLLERGLIDLTEKKEGAEELNKAKKKAKEKNEEEGQKCTDDDWVSFDSIFTIK
jgi:hypothetical protein